MSTTDKLAQLVQTFLVRYSPKDDPAPYAAKGLPQDLDDLAQQARDALAEYKASQSTPAVDNDLAERFADAAQIALNVILTRNGSSPIDDMQAALAAAFPILTQQVERLTAEVEQKTHEANQAKAYAHALRVKCDQLSTERETLSAANARLAKDAERWHTLVALVHAEEWNGWDVHVPSNLRREADGDLVAAVDAATAQAKQAEGGK